MTFRPEFREALALLAEAMTKVTAQGAAAPILVGGGAVEFYTSGAVTSGDFDLVTPNHEAVIAALLAVGFERDKKNPGQIVHPNHKIAVEVVSGDLMDGHADKSRIYSLAVGENKVTVIPVEDLIADRLSQAFSDPNFRKDMLDQAVMLFALAENPDRAYLDKRIAEETAGQANLAYLEGHVNARRRHP